MSSDSMQPNSLDPQYNNEANIQNDEETVVSPEISLPIDDDDLLDVLKRKESDSRQYYETELKLYDRAQKNRDFWRGKQYDDETRFENWQVPYKDNIIYQDLENRIALASARMPDVIVTPSNDNQASMEWAHSFEEILKVKVSNAITQRMMKRGLRFHHLDFRAAIKFRWDPNLDNGAGDFVYELVRPERLLFDHTATIPDNGFTADNMEFITEYVEEPLGLIFAKFPDKKTELLKLLKKKDDGKAGVSKIKYQETWFTWYDDQGQIYEGVCWKYKQLILGKRRNPYYDWEGYSAKSINVDAEGVFKPSLKNEKLFFNYFDRPRKPYIFFTYQNLDASPIDDTTPVEQAIPIQRMINRSGRQISEIADNAVPKKVFAGKYIQKEEARRVTADPDEHIWLDGADDVGKAFNIVTAQPPSPMLIQLQTLGRNRIDSLFSTHGTTRGESTGGGESGLSKQISREGDITVADDLVDIVVERVVSEIAHWSVQMMKLFYDEPHYIRHMGQDGTMLNQQVKRQDIQDGIGVEVKSSSVDKQTRRADALNLASRKAIDPLTMFEDLDMPNPKERTRRVMAFNALPQDGGASYLAEIALEFEHTNKTPPGATGGQNADANQAQTDIQSIVQGQDVKPPKQFDETYVQTFLDFVHSGQMDSIDPDAKKKLATFVKQLQEAAGNFMNRGAVTAGAPNQVPAGEETQGAPTLPTPGAPPQVPQPQ